MAALSSRFIYAGTETTEVSITRVGSSADPTGQVQSRKIVTTANTEWVRPFKAEPYVIWNPTAGANVDVTVYGTVNSVALPLNDEIFMEVAYLTLAAAVRATLDGGTSNTTLSNNNLTATHANATSNAGARSGLSKTSGKYYFEATFNTTPSAGDPLGILQGAGTFANLVGGQLGVVVFGSGIFYSNGGQFVGGAWNVGAIVAGDVVSVAVNFDTGFVWFRRNGGAWNNSGISSDPAVGTNGVTLVSPSIGHTPAVGFTSGGSGNAVTMNFGATAYAYAPPSGFGDWIAPAAPLGKIVTTTKSNVLAAGSAVAADASSWNVSPTWDAATVANVTLSGGNLVATNTGTTSTNQGACAAANFGRTTGKHYFEVTWTTVSSAITSNHGVGVATTASSYATFGSSGAGGVNAYKSGGAYANGSYQGAITTSAWVSGNTIAIAVDLDNRRIWFKSAASSDPWNMNGTANPATNTGGIVIPPGTMVPFLTFGGTGGTANNMMTANFGASAFSGTVPSGFASGWFGAYTPFKLTTTLNAPQPGLAGYIDVRVRAAKPSTTYYIDSTVVLTPAAGGTTNASTAYKSARYTYEGTETTETSITRVGGAVDPTGQAQSRKIVTSANAQWLRPFKAEPYAIWNNTIGSNVTVTLCGTVNSSALPLNDEIFMEVEYLTLNGGAPLGKLVTTTKANVLAASAAVAADSSTWNNLGTISSLATFDGVPTNTTLSNGNLTVTRTSSGVTAAGARGALLMGAGKFYFEVKVTAAHAWGDIVGVLLSTASYTNHMNLVNSSSVCVGEGASNNGSIFANGSSTTYWLGTIANGDTISVAVDFNARLAWFRKNGGSWNGNSAANPATLVNGVVIGVGTYSPAVTFGSSGSVAGDAMTANFGATAYTYTPPPGFGNWGNFWTPFKLTTTLNSPQPGVAGYIHTRVRAGLPSMTYYIDPKITLS